MSERPRCEREASCEPGDHTYSWPCEYAPGTGSLAVRLEDRRAGQRVHRTTQEEQ